MSAANTAATASHSNRSVQWTDLVSDPALCHNRDRDRGLDFLDHLGVAHARNASLSADVRGNALESHHCREKTMASVVGLCSRRTVGERETVRELERTRGCEEYCGEQEVSGDCGIHEGL